MKTSLLSVLSDGSWENKDIFTNQYIVLFAVPGAFTPTCSEQHLPGFVLLYDQFKQRGIDEVYCLSVNDRFVMQAWAKQMAVSDTIKMIADGSALFTQDNTLILDLTDKGLGIRSKRYAMIIKNGTVLYTGFDDDAFAENILAQLTRL